RTPAALAGDDLVGVAQRWPDHERLHQPALADRSGELSQLALGEVPPRVEPPRLQRRERNAPLLLFGAPRLLRAIADQRCEPPAQSRFLRAYRHGGLLPVDSPINDHAARIRRSRSITSD